MTEEATATIDETTATTADTTEATTDGATSSQTKKAASRCHLLFDSQTNLLLVTQRSCNSNLRGKFFVSKHLCAYAPMKEGIYYHL